MQAVGPVAAASALTLAQGLRVRQCLFSWRQLDGKKPVLRE